MVFGKKWKIWICLLSCRSYRNVRSCQSPANCGPSFFFSWLSLWYLSSTTFFSRMVKDCKRTWRDGRWSALDDRRKKQRFPSYRLTTWRRNFFFPFSFFRINDSWMAQEIRFSPGRYKCISASCRFPNDAHWVLKIYYCYRPFNKYKYFLFKLFFYF